MGNQASALFASNAASAVLASSVANNAVTAAGIQSGQVVKSQTSGNYSTIGGGLGNAIRTSAHRSTIAGGCNNEVKGFANESTIAGGANNTVQTNSTDAAIGGGNANTIDANSQYATIGGGSGNHVGNSALVPGADGGTIPGGVSNTVAGYCGFAAGHQAKAVHKGAFVWADATSAEFASSGDNQFLVRASGGVGIGTASPSCALHVASSGDSPQLRLTQTDLLNFARLRLDVREGVPWDITATAGLAPSLNFNIGMVNVVSINPSGIVTAQAFVPLSDRNAKENFKPVEPREILDRLADLPIQTWNFKQDAGTRHIGPVARDFYAAFGVGADDKHIATVDADGVALAAIQGLNQKVQTQDAALRSELQAKEARITLLEQEVARLTALVDDLVEKGNGGGQ